MRERMKESCYIGLIFNFELIYDFYDLYSFVRKIKFSRFVGNFK